MRSTGDETLEAWARDITVADPFREEHLPNAVIKLREFRDAVIQGERGEPVDWSERIPKTPSRTERTTRHE